MVQNSPHDSPLYLSTLTATRGEQRLAVAVLALSLLVFAAVAPFAKTQLPAVGAFIPAYEAALVVIDLITVALLFGQYFSFQSRALFVLASGYLYTALMTVAHALTFPGLFSPTGLFGAGPQSTAWLYMFWHGGFPLFVIAYASLKGGEAPTPQPTKYPQAPAFVASALLLAIVAAATVLVTAGQSALPPIMSGHNYTASMITVVSLVWLLSLVALAALWWRKPHSVLDLWLMVVMCAWLIDIALSAVLNQGRFDVGFYAGRLYGLLAASFVLLVLLAESGMLYRKLVRLTVTLHRLTTQDALTEVANRRAFDGALDLEWRSATRGGMPLALIMIDVDHFKQFNDGYGHVAGDQCLRAVGAALQATVTRANDLVARYGGEEFAVLLPQTDAEAAGLVAERLRSAVAELAMPHRASPTGAVTVSIGVACVRPTWDGTQESPPAAPLGSSALVEMADQALYAAKSSGRNKVVVKR